MKRFLIGCCIFILIIVLFVIYKRYTSKKETNPAINLEVKSSAFAEGGMIPVKYTGRGENISPPIELGNLDSRVKTIAIIMDDLNHPLGIYNHWVIWNIPAQLGKIPENVPKGEVVDILGNAIQGKSEYGGRHYYRGPLPPFGVHKYIFKVYALDVVLELDKNANKKELKKAMEGHIIQYGELNGKFGEK